MTIVAPDILRMLSALSYHLKLSSSKMPPVSMDDYHKFLQAAKRDNHWASDTNSGRWSWEWDKMLLQQEKYFTSAMVSDTSKKIPKIANEHVTEISHSHRSSWCCEATEVLKQDFIDLLYSTNFAVRILRCFPAALYRQCDEEMRASAGWWCLTDGSEICVWLNQRTSLIISTFFGNAGTFKGRWILP